MNNFLAMIHELSFTLILFKAFFPPQLILLSFADIGMGLGGKEKKKIYYNLQYTLWTQGFCLFICK